MFPQAESYPVYASPEHPEVVLPACPINKVLRGQAAIVTGGSSGIGKAIAIALGYAGANVIVNYLKGDDEAAQVAEEAGRCGLRAASRPSLPGDAGLPWTPTGERLLQRPCPDGWLEARLASLRWGSEVVRPEQRPLYGRHGVASRISLQRRVRPGTRRCGRPAGRRHADVRSGRGPAVLVFKAESQPGLEPFSRYRPPRIVRCCRRPGG